MNNQDTVLRIILHGGNAKSLAMEAIMYAKAKDFEASRKSLNEAAEEIDNAHRMQTDSIQKEAAGEKSQVTLLMVHAQDHLMNAMTMIDLAKEIVEIYEKIG